jgi:hypothetical protein
VGAGHYTDGIKAVLDVLSNKLTNNMMFDRYENTAEFEDAHAALLWRDGQGGGNAPSEEFKSVI